MNRQVSAEQTKECLQEKQLLEDGPRFQVLNKSDSGHCCFVATIVDTHRPEVINSYRGFEVVCELFDSEWAQKVADALNEKEDRT